MALNFSLLFRRIFNNCYRLANCSDKISPAFFNLLIFSWDYKNRVIMQLFSINCLIIWLILPSLKFAEHKKVKLNGIEFVYRQKLLLAEKFVNVEFLVPFPKLPENLEIKLQNISDILEQWWQKYQFGCNLTFMNTNEKLLDFQHLSKFTSE